MLQLTDITIGYPSKPIAEHLSAHLNKGRLTCLIGRNGTGKSTLMRTIAGFQQPLHGTMPFASLSPNDLAKTVGVVLTERPDLQGMTVFEMAAMGRSPYTGFWGTLSDDDTAIVNDAIDLVGMSSFAKRRISTLSDGETQKVMIAKALAQQTPLILLDEPTAFLDYPSKVETLLMLRRLCHEEGKTVLLSTHDLDVAMRLTDDVWFMKKGELLTGTPQSLDRDIKEFMSFQLTVDS